MTSPAQILANRQNASLSTGPQSPAGKLAVSKNALRHGCSATHVVLAHESTTDFEDMLLQSGQDFEPANTHELFMVETMVQARWRLARLRRFETAALDLLLGAADPQAPDTILAKSLIGKDGDPMAKIERYAMAAERTYHKAFRQLAEAQKARMRQKAEQSQPPCEAANTVNETKPLEAPRLDMRGPEDDDEFIAFMDQIIASSPALAARVGLPLVLNTKHEEAARRSGGAGPDTATGL